MPRKHHCVVCLFLAICVLARHDAFAQATEHNPSNGSGKPAIDAKDECKISGMVVKMAGSEPIRGATVQLQSTDDRMHAVTTVTDAGGRFQLKEIEPGQYKLRVWRNGFVLQEYGQRKADDPGSILSLHAGQVMTDILFRLTSSAVISGRVLSEDGEPQPWNQVVALRQKYEQGTRKLVAVASFETNDLGEYRLFALPPGRYFIRVTPQGRESRGEQQKSSDSSPEQGYGATYYPGTTDLGRASSLTIRAGEEIPSIDILLRPIAVYRVRGRVLNELTHKAGVNTYVGLIPRGRNQEWIGSMRFSSFARSDGTFQIDDVTPGSYFLTSYWIDEGKGHVGRTAVDVTDANLDGITVTITNGLTIDGKVEWSGAPSMKDEELSISLHPNDESFGPGFRGQAHVSQKGTFSVKDLSEGTYEVSVWGQSEDCYIKDVQYGEHEALENGFTVTRGASATLEVTISSRGARVQGNVTNADHLPAAGVWVVLVPEPPNRSKERLYKTQTTDQYGHFDIHGIAPGDYKLFSWDEVEEGAWEDQDFLKPIEEKGERVDVRELDQKTVNLTSIASPASEETIKP